MKEVNEELLACSDFELDGNNCNGSHSGFEVSSVNRSRKSVLVGKEHLSETHVQGMVRKKGYVLIILIN
jgi:hypothetical protein